MQNSPQIEKANQAARGFARHAYYNESDAQKAAWLRELIARDLIAPGDVDERSICDVRPDDLRGYRQCHFFAGIGIWSYALRLAGWEDEREVWTGSCPCQPFSAAGKGEAFNDERHLWPEFFRLIEARRPECVFGEQVSSIDGLTWFDAVQADLDRALYTVGCIDTCAASVGAPHQRHRLYWVADGTFERLANADSLQSQQSSWEGAGAIGASSGRSFSESSGRGPVNGFWRSADWVLTRPQRVGDRPGLRPVESGSFPLASGATSRVGRLRGYGDGIVAEVAKTFIQAYLSIAAIEELA